MSLNTSSHISKMSQNQNAIYYFVWYYSATLTKKSQFTVLEGLACELQV